MRTHQSLQLRRSVLALIVLTSAFALTDTSAYAAKMGQTVSPNKLKVACGNAGGSYGSNGVAYWCDGTGNSVTCTKKPNACYATSNALRQEETTPLGLSAGAATSDAPKHRNLGAATVGQATRLGPLVQIGPSLN